MSQSVDITDTSKAGLAEHAPSKSPAAECVRAVARPASMDLEIGNLTIRAGLSDNRPGHAIAGYKAQVLVDGKPFPIRSIVIRGSIYDAWVVEMEFFPTSVEKAREASDKPLIVDASNP